MKSKKLLGYPALPPDGWLCPSGEVPYIFGLCPWCGLWPNKSEGLSPHQGHSPGIVWLLSAGHSHRRTSGGKAEPDMAYDF